jgi:hypothetical protein
MRNACLETHQTVHDATMGVTKPNGRSIDENIPTFTYPKWVGILDGV